MFNVERSAFYTDCANSATGVKRQSLVHAASELVQVIRWLHSTILGTLRT
jgi:hypothetical protein